MGKSKGISEQTPKDDSPIVSTRTQDKDASGLLLHHNMGNAVSHEQGRLSIDFVDTSEVMVVLVDNKLILGRSGQGDPGEIMIDLSPYGASDKGVSRRHARLHRTTAIIYITDLNSRNGTFLNGERLSPHQARILRDDDEVHLGRLVFRVRLQ
jgi:hypothetical protein